MNYPLRRSCKEVANMVFQNQFSVMKNAMRQWRNYAHEDAESGPSDAAN
jgi:hypothetical protein